MRALVLASAMSAIGCGGPTGDVTVFLDAEDTITRGLDAGEGDEDIVDGWSVRFAKYLVAVGEIRLARTADGQEAHDDAARVIDLAALPPGGVELTRFEALDALRWDRFEYATPHATGATRDESVSEADFDAMVANEWTYLIEGTLENPSGESCPPDGACRAATALSFRAGASVATSFGPCEGHDGLPGVTVTEGGTAVSITIHGDHLFFDTFPSAAEVIERRAQWLANADLDGDDTITTEELMAIDAAALFPSSTYSLAGAPYPLETAFDFARSQLATQGHFQGEGECPWATDGGHGGHDH